MRRLIDILLTIVLLAFLLWSVSLYVIQHRDWAPKLFFGVMFLLVILYIVYRRSMLYRCGKVMSIYCGDNNIQLDWLRIKRSGWTWTLPFFTVDAVPVTRFRTHTEAIEQSLHASFAVDYYGRRYWARVGTRRLPNLLHFDDIPKPYKLFNLIPRDPVPKGGLMAWFGTSQWGTLWVDLSTLPHIVVGGTTRSGKSVQMRSILTQVCLRYSPRYVKLALADLKGRLEFNTFEGLPHIMGDIRHNLSGYSELLADIEQERDRRYEILHQAKCDDIQSYNASLYGGQENPTWINYILLVVDEFGRLQPGIGVNQAERQERQNLLARTAELAAVGGALGIHVMIGTQRPDAQVFPGDLKANFPATIALRVKNRTNSQILLDNDLAASLPVAIRGRGIFQYDEDTFFQGPWIPKQLARTKLDALREGPSKPIHEDDEELIPPGEMIPHEHETADEETAA